jgi:hypothetical protein
MILVGIKKCNYQWVKITLLLNFFNHTAHEVMNRVQTSIVRYHIYESFNRTRKKS